jgi:CBS domain containing-hemolysin-like protein
MTWPPILLLLIGLALSAFFSGSETGFYRVPRVRLLIDSQAGDPLARGLLWLTNHPSLFVATTLIGNNLANYVTSLAIVMATAQLFTRGGVIAELAAPIFLAPLLFVYGELLPKNLYFHTPNRLLRAGGPLFLIFTVLFMPLSVLLWALSKSLEWFAGESPQKLQRRLARKELKRVLEEGHDIGILWPSQRALAQGIFAVANRPVTAFTTSLDCVPSVSQSADRSQTLRVARQHQLSAVPVHDPVNDQNITGYLDVTTVYLDESAGPLKARPLLEISAATTQVAALMCMQDAGESLARVVNASGETVGIVTVEQLYEPLFRGGQ